MCQIVKSWAIFQNFRFNYFQNFREDLISRITNVQNFREDLISRIRAYFAKIAKINPREN